MDEFACLESSMCFLHAFGVSITKWKGKHPFVLLQSLDSELAAQVLLGNHLSSLAERGVPQIVKVHVPLLFQLGQDSAMHTGWNHRQNPIAHRIEPQPDASLEAPVKPDWSRSLE